MARAFIYGTLKRGHRAHDRLAGQTFVAAAVTVAKYRLVDAGGFPGLVAGSVSVQGEIWELDAGCLRALDEYEGVAEGIYAREPVELSDGSTAQTYWYLRASRHLCDCGPFWTKADETADPRA